MEAADSRRGPAQLRGLAARQRARLTTIGMIGGYFLLLLALGGRSGWSRLGVAPGSLEFQDLNNVTSAWECTRRGIRVLPVNPCDPDRRPADFPHLWLVPSPLGLGPGDTVLLGWILAVVFLAATVAVIPGRARIGTAIAYGLGVCSPAVMLGVERGNPDLLLFPLVVAAVLVTSRTRAWQAVSAGLLLVVAALKFYPLLAAGFLLRRATRTSLIWLGAVAVASGIYMLAILGQIHEILASIPQSNVLAYGVRRLSYVFSAAAREVFDGRFTSYRAWDIGLDLLGLAGGWLVFRSLRGTVRVASDDPDAQRDLELFWAGACLYVGSYMIFVSQDYRLIFALLTIPQLVRWVRERRLIAYATAVAFVATLGLDGSTKLILAGRVVAWWDRLTAVGPDVLPFSFAAIGQFALLVLFAGWLLATAPTFPWGPRIDSANRGERYRGAR
ncbi:MAG TPA: glycosyltransferase 87 family protein [Gaiellaceae bacterium]